MINLHGLRALIVEDEAAVALLIEDMLLELGCEVAATAARLAVASEKASTVACDFALLDVNLDGQPVFPVARILADRRIPFVFSTGYGAGIVPAAFSGAPVLAKPFAIEDLEQKLRVALGAE
jgi:CheY-like chemotaxis protein